MKTVTAIIIWLILGCGIAHADSDDDTTYLTAIHNHGITDKAGDSALISFGHSVCKALAAGYSMNALEDMGDMNERNGLSDDDVKFLIKAAAATYCPESIQ
jgi:Protein of unknown function (DUF732)